MLINSINRTMSMMGQLLDPRNSTVPMIELPSEKPSCPREEIQQSLTRVTPETAGRLKNIPLLGAFVDSGATHYVKFEDVKKLIAALFKEMAVAKGILKGE